MSGVQEVSPIVVIPARLESSRLPRKLLIEVGGRSIIEWTYRRALAAEEVAGVVIATDSSEIASVARGFGAEVLETGPARSGSDRVAEAARRLGRRAHFVINLQADEPLIDPRTISAVARAMRRWPEAIVTAARPIRRPEEFLDPSCVKVVATPEGRVLYFSRSPIPGSRTGPQGVFEARRAPLAHVGLYGYPEDLLQRFCALPASQLEEIEGLEQLRALEAGMEMRLVLVEDASPSLDTPEDLLRIRPALEAGG